MNKLSAYDTAPVNLARDKEPFSTDREKRGLSEEFARILRFGFHETRLYFWYFYIEFTLAYHIAFITKQVLLILFFCYYYSDKYFYVLSVKTFGL